METKAIQQRLKDRFGAAIINAEPETIDPWVQVSAEKLHDVCRSLRDDPDLHMDYLHLISGVDYLDDSPRLEVWYHMSSIVLRHRLVVRVVLPRWENDQVGQLPKLATVSDIWKTANWHEREVYDLSGVEFTDHGDLQRLLCPEDWEGHPLRKDYETPSEYHGIPVK
jgi:NADH-quinone oxidoreductase subunit C